MCTIGGTFSRASIDGIRSLDGIRPSGIDFVDIIGALPKSGAGNSRFMMVQLRFL